MNIASVEPRTRLDSLDVFRGLTIAGMLLVNNPGAWSAIYPPLGHAAWHGWTPTDLIFPFFLFIVGITTHLSLEAKRRRGVSNKALVVQIFKRGGLIILLGLLLNAFPFYTTGTIEGMPDPTFIERVSYKLAHLRIPGVLQRIGLVYIIAALLTLKTTLKQQVAIIVALLLGYWLLLTVVPVPGTGLLGAALLDRPDMTLAAWSDRILLGENHLWRSTKTWDPEGPLSTLPAVATAMLGFLAGRWIDRKDEQASMIAGLFAYGSLGMMVGLMWNWVFPINKSLWTSSYVVFTAGMGAVVLASCIWLIDYRGVRWWTKPFIIFGTNAILAFVGSGLMAKLTGSLIKVPYGDKSVPLQAAIYQTLYSPWFSPRNASLLFALSFVILWLLILWIFYRRGIFLKV